MKIRMMSKFISEHALTRDYPSVLLQCFLEFTKVAKELKLMTFAEGISVHQYIDGWLMTSSVQHCQVYAHCTGGASC